MENNVRTRDSYELQSRVLSRWVQNFRIIQLTLRTQLRRKGYGWRSLVSVPLFLFFGFYYRKEATRQNPFILPYVVCYKGFIWISTLAFMFMWCWWRCRVTYTNGHGSWSGLHFWQWCMSSKNVALFCTLQCQPFFGGN